MIYHDVIGGRCTGERLTLPAVHGLRQPLEVLPHPGHQPAPRQGRQTSVPTLVKTHANHVVVAVGTGAEQHMPVRRPGYVHHVGEPLRSRGGAEPIASAVEQSDFTALQEHDFGARGVGQITRREHSHLVEPVVTGNLERFGERGRLPQSAVQRVRARVEDQFAGAVAVEIADNTVGGQQALGGPGLLARAESLAPLLGLRGGSTPGNRLEGDAFLSRHKSRHGEKDNVFRLPANREYGGFVAAVAVEIPGAQQSHGAADRRPASFSDPRPVRSQGEHLAADPSRQRHARTARAPGGRHLPHGRAQILLPKRLTAGVQGVNMAVGARRQDLVGAVAIEIATGQVKDEAADRGIPQVLAAGVKRTDASSVGRADDRARVGPPVQFGRGQTIDIASARRERRDRLLRRDSRARQRHPPDSSQQHDQS